MMKNSHTGNTSQSYSQLFSSYFSVTTIFEESLYHDAIQMFDGYQVMQCLICKYN